MTALRGRAHIKLDPKGRLSLPTSFRNGFGRNSQLVITNNTDDGQRFLDVHPRADWEKLEKKVASWPQMKPEVIAFQRFYISSAEFSTLDSQGRLLIPQHFRLFADFDEDLVVVGMGRKLEIWAEKVWTARFNQIEKDFSRITQILADL